MTGRYDKKSGKFYTDEYHGKYVDPHPVRSFLKSLAIAGIILLILIILF